MNYWSFCNVLDSLTDRFVMIFVVLLHLNLLHFAVSMGKLIANFDFPLSDILARTVVVSQEACNGFTF
jgi:hypothetical protein